jgi:threonine synthase
MRPLVASFESAVDREHEACRSVVLRYRRAVRLGEPESRDEALKELLARSSIAEGVRTFRLLRYAGVDLHVLDETSAMHTGTLKSIDGCVTIAQCLHAGLERIVFESGGNTGSALVTYAARAGIETFCFVPAENLNLLDSRAFAGARAHLFAVEDPGMVREAAERFAERYGVARVPRAEWRISASRFLGCFLLETLLGGTEFDYLVQTISAGFGPIGIYDVLFDHEPHLGRIPRFVGVQQAANCAMFEAWRVGSADVPTPPVRSTRNLLSRVMYDSRPQSYGTFDRLASVVERTGGHLTTLSAAEFERTLAEHPAGRSVLELLRANGVAITLRDGEIVDRTGLIALAGALAEIDRGAIASGSSVLCCLTSGAARPDGCARPEFSIRELANLDRALATRSLAETRHA